jgi:hypothetical protein
MAARTVSGCLRINWMSIIAASLIKEPRPNGMTRGAPDAQ